jgi:hypothetical protein
MSNIKCQTTEQLKLKEIAGIVIEIVPILPNLHNLTRGNNSVLSSPTVGTRVIKMEP